MPERILKIKLQITKSQKIKKLKTIPLKITVLETDVNDLESRMWVCGIVIFLTK